MKLEAKNLNFRYTPASRLILRDFNVRVSEGEFVSLLGPSGCGKSTFLNVLAGILTDYEGEIFIDGERITGMSGHFAYMPQNDLLLPWRTVLDNVCLYSEIHHNKKDVIDKAREQMVRFGLEGCEDKYPSELSGGMRQRAAFLRTALCDADILLLDEPFGALDVITRGQLQDWLYELCQELNRTVLLVTHDTDEAIYLSDRILVLGQPGEGIRDEITISEPDRNRDWLYAQGDLRARIHRIISNEQH
ncbi:MAG: ABC transporter ATP-binding protein [Lachnospiraceae bacterium]|nr:ABC transporter ATP-binding protein [Lachnospiraceae bacterium]